MEYRKMDRIRKSLSQTNVFVRFVLVGLLNTTISFFIIIFLLEIGEWGYWPSTFIGNSCGVVCSFFFNRAFTFQSKIGVGEGGLLFLLVTMLSYFVAYSSSPFIAIFFSAFLFSEEQWAVLIGMGIYTVVNFFGQKHFVFQK